MRRPLAVAPGLARSEECLRGLQPEVASRARGLITSAYEIGIPLVAVSCYRTGKQQQRLYDKGRTTEGEIVTSAKPGRSWHQHRRAFDVAVLVDGRPTWPSDERLWNAVGAIGERLGLSWGKKFGDRPHFSYHPGLSMNQAYASWRGSPDGMATA